MAVPTPLNVRRHFLSWERPLLPQAANWLAGDWSGAGPLDLSGTLVVVPTRQSGRRLREALAELAAARGSAVLAPRVELPEDLVEAAIGPDVATRLAAQLAWAETIHQVDHDEFRAVFPVDPPVRNFTWAVRLATQMQRLQTALGENGLRLGDVVRRAGEGLPETERWLQLAELEKRCDTRLAAHGWVEPQAARLASARASALPDGITRVVLLATPDPLPLAIAVLADFARQLAVDVVVYASENEADAFDEWGRPRVESWGLRPLQLQDFSSQVHLCADAAQQAAFVTELARRYGEPEGVLAVGLGDAEVAPVLAGALRNAGVAVFDPGGRSRRGDRLHALLSALATLVREPSFESVETLARCPDFLAWLDSRGGGGVSAARVLRELDQLHTWHLPTSVEAALAHVAKRPAARAALEGARDLGAILTQGVFPANAASVLSEMFGARRIAGDPAFVESAEVWMDLLREAEAIGAEFPDLAAAEWWELVLAQFGESLRFETRPVGAVDLLGWLELLWENAPHLVVTGLNDGRVPETVVGDPFLPETLRGRLGLKTNEARFARDAYLLTAMEASRRQEGRLDLLVGKMSASGDPLRPSRLLLQCEEAELPARVAALFRPVDASRAAPSWRRAWRLVPPVVPPPTRVSVTAFRDYLWCPFRFYLKHAVKLETVDPDKNELDALDFGILCHAALEEMGKAVALRDCTDPAELKKFLLGQVDRHSRTRYGAELTLPLLVQLESARQRLGRAAELQAEQRAAGWVIEHVERKFELKLGAVTVSAKIDRIERHLETGAWRVIDYKTSDSGVSPLAAHVRNERREESAPEWARFTIGDKQLVWTDLQLPLYLAALADEFGRNVGAGYFNLPKAVGETALVVWEDYDETWRSAAMRCAEGVVAGVSEGKFWPPTEVSPRDEDDVFAGFFHQGTAASVDWRGKP